jgi:thioredoxin 1
MMKHLLVLMSILSIALVLGCGGESEESVAEKRIEPETGPEESVDIAGGPADAEAEDDEAKLEPGEATGKSKQESNVRKAEGKPVDVGDSNLESVVLKSDMPVLVDFWAPWCKPCLLAAPVLEKMAEQYAGRLKVCKLNVDQARQTAMKYGIRSIPTLIIYKDGQPVDQIVGVTPNYESDLKRKIESHL